MKFATITFYLLSVLACLTLGGCSPPEPKSRPTADVSGTVTLDGKPMPDGEIFFVNVSEGVQEVLPVKDGRFTGKASLGQRKVEIRSYREVPPAKEVVEMYGADAPKTKENFIPTNFNTETTLTADIKAGAALEFAVTSQ